MSTDNTGDRGSEEFRSWMADDSPPRPLTPEMKRSDYDWSRFKISDCTPQLRSALHDHGVQDLPLERDMVRAVSWLREDRTRVLAITADDLDAILISHGYPAVDEFCEGGSTGDGSSTG